MPNGLIRKEPLVLTNVPETAERYRGLGREVLETPPTPEPMAAPTFDINTFEGKKARRNDLLRKFDERNRSLSAAGQPVMPQTELQNRMKTEGVWDVSPPVTKAPAADKWNKDAAARLDKLYGTQTEMGIVVDPERMAEYQDANTYLADYKAKGLTANDAAVLASRRAVAGGIDPIQQVIDQQRAAGKSDKEIKGMLRKSQFKSVSPRIYGLK